MADKTEKKQRGAGRPFESGQSGNPNGRPKGSRNKTLLLLEQMIEEEAQEICRAVIEQAKGGDLQAAKILIDRMIPPKKDRPINLDLPKLDSLSDVLKANSLILNAASSGEITPLEAESLLKVTEAFNKTFEILELETRLKTLEERCNIDETS